MIKAVTIHLCVSILLATASTLPAQTDTASAVNEALRRQADRITLRQKLVDARAAEQRHDLSLAAKTYDEAWTLIEGIGPGVDAERSQTVAGLTVTRMQLAKAAEARGDLRDAKLQLDDLLRVNSQDVAAQQYKAQIDKQLAAQKKFSPDQDLLDQLPAIQKDKDLANTYVQDARVLFQAGKFDAADAKLVAALKLDPGSESANYYSSLVKQARLKRSTQDRNLESQAKIVQVENSWPDSNKRLSLPVPNPIARTNLVNTSPARQAIIAKLDLIRLDKFAFEESVPLAEVVRTLDQLAKKRDPSGKGINFIMNSSPAAAQSVVTTGPAVGGAGGFGGAAGGEGRFAPPQQVPPTDPATGLPMATQTTQAEQVDIKNDVHIQLNPGLSDIRLADALDAIITVADHPIKYSVFDYAVVFSLKGSESAPLSSRRFKVDPNTFLQGLESVSGVDFASTTSGSSSGGGGQGGGGGGQSGGGGGGGQSGGGGGQNGNSGGGSLFPRVSVTGGVSSQGGGQQGGQQGGGQQGGQQGGQGGQNGGGLNAVTRVSTMSLVQSAVIAFFRAEGVILDPPKSVFFNDREGSLWVRATSEDLDIIEQAIQTLNIAPPEVNIKVKFVEVTQGENKALGFDWYMGNINIGGKAAASAGTQPSFSGASTAVNPEGTFPGSFAYSTATAPAASDGLLTSGLRNSLNAPALGSLTGILTDPQFKVVLRALEQRDGTDELTDGQVTTLSGRQAQFQAVDLRYIVTGSGVQSGTGGTGTASPTTGNNNNNNGNGTVVQAQQAIIPVATPIPLGPTIDVIPYVSADGYTIQMTLIPTLVEFLGYDDPGQFVIQAQNGTGAPLTSVLPLPRFRLRQVTTSCIVWDGQTVVLGGLITDNVSRVKDQVPVLGDLPWVGRLFRSEQSKTAKANLLIFVSPTIIDPAGNRVHRDEDLPFEQQPLKPTAASF